MKLYKKNLNNVKKILESIIGVEEDSVISDNNTIHVPTLGGCRMYNYENVEQAEKDVKRLAHGMTLNAAAAGLDLGGGKSIIWGDSSKDKTEQLFEEFGEFVESLNGIYITAEDVGTSVEDMVHAHKKTNYVVGLPDDGMGSGDPSPVTALGVFKSMHACVKEVYGKSNSLEGLTVAIQGLGHVGTYLTELVLENGANVIASDINVMKIKDLKKFIKKSLGRKYLKNLKFTEHDEIYTQNAEIFAPCALGAIINSNTIPLLTSHRLKIICGAANNQLEKLEHGVVLKDNGILYAPDYVANAGGLINVSVELEGRKTGKGYDQGVALEKVNDIYDTMKDIIDISKAKNIPTSQAADELAISRVDERKKKFNVLE